jgi:hypothetical protein
LKQLRESALNAPAIFKFDPSDQTTSEMGRYFSDTGTATGPAPMKDERRPATIKSDRPQMATTMRAMRACGRSREEQYVATALLFQLDPDAFADGTVEQQSDAEAEWNSTTRDGKLTRLCESTLSYRYRAHGWKPTTGWKPAIQDMRSMWRCKSVSTTCTSTWDGSQTLRTAS